MGRPERGSLELIFLEFPKICFGPTNHRQGIFLDDFRIFGNQKAWGV